jgi:hypothetical protein
VAARFPCRKPVLKRTVQPATTGKLLTGKEKLPR